MIHHGGKAVAGKPRKRAVRIPTAVLGKAVVEVGQRVLHDRERQFVQFRFVRKAEGGGKPELREARADFFAEKSVDGGNVRTAEREYLSREMRISGVRRQRVAERLGNAAFQLRRRRAGEGDNQKS